MPEVGHPARTTQLLVGAPCAVAPRRMALRGLLVGILGTQALPQAAVAQARSGPDPAASSDGRDASADGKDDAQPEAASTGGTGSPAAFIDVPIWEGLVSFYGRGFAGRRTASGERFDPKARTMAHRFLPFGSWVKVTLLPAGPSIVVRVNDRGPAVAGRIGDLSHAAAKSLGMISAGVVRARLELLKSGPEGR